MSGPSSIQPDMWDDLPSPANSKPPEQQPNRLVVTENVYHQLHDRDAQQHESSFHISLVTDEDPYARRTTVGEEWIDFPTGWLNRHVSMVVISNEEGMRLQRNPTPDEQADIAKKVIELGHGGVVEWLVFPNSSMRGFPANVGKMQIRCRSGEAKFSVFCVPE